MLHFSHFFSPFMYGWAQDYGTACLKAMSSSPMTFAHPPQKNPYTPIFALAGLNPSEPSYME